MIACFCLRGFLGAREEVVVRKTHLLVKDFGGVSSWEPLSFLGKLAGPEPEMFNIGITTDIIEPFSNIGN